MINNLHHFCRSQNSVSDVSTDFVIEEIKETTAVPP